MIVASLFDGLLTLFVFLGYDIHFLFLVLYLKSGLWIGFLSINVNKTYKTQHRIFAAIF